MASCAAAALAAGVGRVDAGERCVGQCFEKVATPPVYGSVAEQVMVAPPRHVVHRTPAEFAVVPRPVTIAPEHTVARYVPAEYASVAETVMVSPGGKRWVVRRDYYGREIGCWEVTPPEYATRTRSVVVRPAATLYERVPAVTAMRAQHVMVRPPSVSYETIPAEYATRQRTVLVSPGGAEWRPIGRGY
ncbi:hypothetical protein [Terrarubrum flagellatum]|uniref:hypothetical protein n=1 Tax=Terrirubrum flagellatum TaxID=2895980 RepID=UPI003145013C